MVRYLHHPWLCFNHNELFVDSPYLQGVAQQFDWGRFDDSEHDCSGGHRAPHSSS